MAQGLDKARIAVIQGMLGLKIDSDNRIGMEICFSILYCKFHNIQWDFSENEKLCEDLKTAGFLRSARFLGEKITLDSPSIVPNSLVIRCLAFPF